MSRHVSEGRWVRDQYQPKRFDAERYADENLAFWIPVFIEIGRIEPHHRLLDVGCATGGFTQALGAHAGRLVVGLDASTQLLRFARRRRVGVAGWLQGDAESLPFRSASFDRIVASLVVHQLVGRSQAFAEAFRVLTSGGVLLVRTVTPGAAAHHIPSRFFPSIRAAQAARMPPVEVLTEELRATGFRGIEVGTVIRNKRLVLEEVEASFRQDVVDRYPWLEASELESGIVKMREEANRNHPWVDPRPATLIVATADEGC